MAVCKGHGDAYLYPLSACLPVPEAVDLSQGVRPPSEGRLNVTNTSSNAPLFDGLVHVKRYGQFTLGFHMANMPAGFGSQIHACRL